MPEVPAEIQTLRPERPEWRAADADGRALAGSRRARAQAALTRFLRMRYPALSRAVHIGWTFHSYAACRRRLASRNGQDALRVVIGASGSYRPGWIPTEDYYLDLTSEDDWSRLFGPAEIDVLLAEHVFEHLTERDAEEAAERCFRYLKPGGYLRIAVPDGFHPSPHYRRHIRPCGTGPGAEGHRQVYTHQSLTEQLERAGFSVRLLEYFDENGAFHRRSWNTEGGFIRRSSRFDPRNAGGMLIYTSLMADAVKPAGPAASGGNHL